MSSPLIFIFLPVALALFFWFLRSQQLLSNLVSFGTSAAMVLFSQFLPIDQVINLGPFSFEVSSVLRFFGRSFVLGNEEMNLVLLIYGAAAFWFLGSVFIKTNQNFPAVGLAISALSIAVLSVTPFIYAALIIEAIALLSLLLFITETQTINRGVFRFLLYQTLGMIILLLAGWVARFVEADASNVSMIIRAISLIGLGFAFYLAVFPFHSWMPLLAESKKTYEFGFIFMMIPLLVQFMMLEFINEYSWIRDFEQIPSILFFSGLIMVLFVGVLAALQNNYSRLQAYLVLFDTGFFLISISFYEQLGFVLFFWLLIPRILNLALYSLCISQFPRNHHGEPDLSGSIYNQPVLAIGVLISLFSTAGIPLLASFPVRQSIFQLSLDKSVLYFVLLFLGNAGFLLAAFRTISIVSKPKQTTDTKPTNIFQKVLITAGCGLIILGGLFPVWVNGIFEQILLIYPNILENLP